MVASDLFSIPRTKIFSNAIWVIFFNKRFDQATNFFIVTLIGGFFQIFHEATSNYIMVAIKKNFVAFNHPLRNCTSWGIQCSVSRTIPSQHFHWPTWFGQERENRENLISGSRNTLLQSMFNSISVYFTAEKHLSLEVTWNNVIKTFHIVNNVLNHLIFSHHTSYCKADGLP